jgi:signal transduction histidine kinase
MMTTQLPHEQVTYVVGEERGVLEILRVADIRPLLRGAVRAGVSEALLLVDGETICAEAAAGTVPGAQREVSAPLRLEGEIVGLLVVRGDHDNAAIEGIASMLASAMDVILANNLKRMLTTEMHTSVVTQSYDELVAKNQELATSEAKYRELATSLDQQVRQRTNELEIAHARLLQQEKMASVGQLAAGVAHEINNPLGFITSNLGTLQRYTERLLAMLDWYADVSAAGGSLERLRSGAEAKARELKISLIRADLPELLGQSIAGAERVKKIVADLKGYSHIDEMNGRDFDLNGELERSLVVLANQLPVDLQVVRNLVAVPRVRGNGALFSQALTNIIQNACQAKSHGLRLSFTSRMAQGMVELTIADNGPGIPLANRSRIFEPFFTTKAVGSGTGMGLAVVYDFVSSIGGSITVDDAPDGGAAFLLRLPLADAERRDHE